MPAFHPWLIGRQDVDPARVAVGSASAGGNLAAGTAPLARERGVDLASRLLVYPMLDDWTAARAEDLAGSPPAWIGVGTDDLFHDEDGSYARRLRAAGVEVELLEVPGAHHGLDAVQRSAPVSRDSTTAQVAALRGALLP